MRLERLCYGTSPKGDMMEKKRKKINKMNLHDAVKAVEHARTHGSLESKYGQLLMKRIEELRKEEK